MVRGAIVFFFLAGLAAMPAYACGVMDKADPKVGSTVESTDHVSLTFTQAFVPASSDVKITDAAGSAVKADKPVSSEGDTVLSLKTTHPLAPGKYKVRWDLLWLDCNSKAQGDYKFTVK
jgi:methionine-rich copper-binding protein CopC